MILGWKVKSFKTMLELETFINKNDITVYSMIYDDKENIFLIKYTE